MGENLSGYPIFGNGGRVGIGGIVIGGRVGSGGRVAGSGGRVAGSGGRVAGSGGRLIGGRVGRVIGGRVGIGGRVVGGGEVGELQLFKPNLIFLSFFTILR